MDANRFEVVIVVHEFTGQSVMPSSVPFGVASAREMHTRECVEPRRFAEISEFPRVAKLLWPFKTVETFASLVGKKPRTVERWVSGEIDPPWEIVMFTATYIFTRKNM